MAGYNFILKIRRLEETLDELGLMMCHSRHGGGDIDYVAVKPKDVDGIVFYNHDSEIFVGTIEELEYWIRGLKWSRDYDRMLFGKNHGSNRQRKEQDVRNKRIVKILKESSS